MLTGGRADQVRTLLQVSVDVADLECRLDGNDASHWLTRWRSTIAAASMPAGSEPKMPDEDSSFAAQYASETMFGA